MYVSMCPYLQLFLLCKSLIESGRRQTTHGEHMFFSVVVQTCRVWLSTINEVSTPETVYLNTLTMAWAMRTAACTLYFRIQYCSDEHQDMFYEVNGAKCIKGVGSICLGRICSMCYDTFPVVGLVVQWHGFTTSDWPCDACAVVCFWFHHIVSYSSTRYQRLTRRTKRTLEPTEE